MQAAPDNITEPTRIHERRERARHAPSSLSYVSVDSTNGGVIVDISESGMAISSADALALQASHNLRFQLPGADRVFETSADLIWTSDSKKSAGVRFISLAVEDRLQIKNWIKDELFAEAFPARAAARLAPRRNLDISHTSLKAPSSDAREPVPASPRKALADIPVAESDNYLSEFDRLFPSEKSIQPVPSQRPGKFARLASTQNIETTAYWMNFPSELEAAAQPNEAAIRTAEAANGATAESTIAGTMAEPTPIEAAPVGEVVSIVPEFEVEPEASFPAIDALTAHENVPDLTTEIGAHNDIATFESPIAASEAVVADSIVEAPEELHIPGVAPVLEANMEARDRVEAETIPEVSTELAIVAPAVEPAVIATAESVPAELATCTETIPETSPSITEASETPRDVSLKNIVLDEHLLAEPLPSEPIPANEDSAEIPVHDLNPAPEGAVFAAANLDVLDFSQAVRTPGKYAGGAVSDASIESLLAIAEEEETSARKATPLRLVREERPAQSFRKVETVASANALPHVALRSPTQQLPTTEGLTDGDKKYRGLVVVASFVLITVCFGIAYSSHLRSLFTQNRTETPVADSAKNAAPAPESTPAAPVASAPPASSPVVAPAPPATSTPSSTKTPAASKLPDSASVVPDPNFNAPPLPAATQPSPRAFFPVTAPSEGSAPRMVELPEETVFDSPKVAIRLRQIFFVAPQPGPEWKHTLERIQIGESTSKEAPLPARDADSSVVHVRATIGKDGRVETARPIDGPVTLIPRALEAIRQWRYEPSLLDGQPVEWQGDYSIEFRPAR